MKFLLYTTFALATLSLQAQSVKLSEVPGKITGLPVNGSFTGVTGPAATVKTFNTTFGKLLDASMASKPLSTPVGFEVKFFANISKFQPQLGEKRNTGTFNIFLFNYMVNQSGLMKKVDEAPAFIKMYLNATDFFTRTAGFFGAYDERLGIPHPFQSIPVVDSTEDYTTYSFKSYPFNKGYYADFTFRIVRGNNRPVFIPFTRKQYLEYLIAVEKLKIKESEEKTTDFKKELADARKRLAGEKKDDIQKIIRIAIEGNEKAIAREEKWMSDYNDKINGYRAGLADMGAEEENLTAYVDLNRTANARTERLVAPGRREGYALYVVNRHYYDNTQPPMKTQSVMVCYWYHPQFCPDFLKERTRRIFESIDYHRIKESMQ